MTAPNEDNPYAPPQPRHDAAETTVPGERLQKLQLTGIGTLLVYTGMLIIALGAVVAALIALFGSAAGSGSTGQAVVTAITAFGSAGIGITLGLLIMFAGKLLCLSVPSRGTRKQLLTGSIAADVLWLLLICAQHLQRRNGGVFTNEAWTHATGSLLLVLSPILFVLFLMRLGRFLDRPDVTRRGVPVLVVAGALALFTFVSPSASQVDGDSLLQYARFLTIPIGLLMFIMYANFVLAASTAIRKPDARPSAKHVA
ncbi:MAG: hypothetical protein R3C19_15000 [Planctomycetaceae bacterium]